MKKWLFLLMLCSVSFAVAAASVRHPRPVRELLRRIGGAGAEKRFVTLVDPSLSAGGREAFVLTQERGKPCIKGSTLLAVTTGINWYLNHYAHVNLTWNRLTADLVNAPLPLPAKEERHECTAPYRYYLNYCTFSYSMSVWTWERWEREIDWMALHGVNMPLAIVGLEAVWKGMLEELGYTKSEIGAFIAGPAYQAWWAMNNLEGWGGENPAWWYERQAALGRRILARERELGMTPVLQGYSGMLPHDGGARQGLNVADPGTWCTFRRPAFLLPSDPRFGEMARLYYKHLRRVMGVSDYYSMDPFHEGGSTAGVDVRAAYRAIADEMRRVNPRAKWVIQSWNENPSAEALAANPRGTYVVLDLFSDGHPQWQDGYGGHEMIYCMLHNFGGRTGLHGRLGKTMEGYYAALRQYPATMRGVGATPEGIETNPVLYDALFELPWREPTAPSAWLEEYLLARYGTRQEKVAEAWDILLRTVYACPTAQQGASEPVVCARPSLRVQSVSTWSTSQLYYDPEETMRAAMLLASASELSAHPNYRFDLIDVTRQALTDHAQGLLGEIREAYEAKNRAVFRRLTQKFLALILDLDRLLAQEPLYSLGRWTQGARRCAEQVRGTTRADADWMEWNARTLVTVWGTEEAANAGGLHDYSNREWAGLLRDFHYPRWKRFFDALAGGTAVPTAAEWYAQEAAWTRDFSKSYTARPTTESPDFARQLLLKYGGADD